MDYLSRAMTTAKYPMQRTMNSYQEDNENQSRRDQCQWAVRVGLTVEFNTQANFVTAGVQVSGFEQCRESQFDTQATRQGDCSTSWKMDCTPTGS